VGVNDKKWGWGGRGGGGGGRGGGGGGGGGEEIISLYIMYLGFESKEKVDHLYVHHVPQCTE